jgi:hypothetical protein
MLRSRRSLAPLRALGLVFALAAGQAGAADGLLAHASDALWPTLKARIAIQTAAVSPLAWQGLGGGERSPLGLSAGAILGDYTFAQPSFGSFRATSGLLVGPASASMQFGGLSERAASLAMARSNGQGLTIESWSPQPYLGLGFSTRPGGAGLSWTADLGLIAESVASGIAGGRTPLGVQGSDAARRELRLSPVLQFGLRYRF